MLIVMHEQLAITKDLLLLLIAVCVLMLIQTAVIGYIIIAKGWAMTPMQMVWFIYPFNLQTALAIVFSVTER
jgi:hypothetical protein